MQKVPGCLGCVVVTDEFDHFVTVRTQDTKAENEKRACKKSCRPFSDLAEWTGLEPATPGVTGRYSNQLNYHSW